MTPAATPRAVVGRLAIGSAIVALALLTFFRFPGHTWLQQDTQIYVPILEHLRNPSVLDRDLMVQYPHVSYTLYDEVTIGLSRITGLDFEHVLAGLQIAFRALGIWGIFLMAIAAGLDLWGALTAASIFSLGAMIAGPSVLTFEYEPTPRALAIPLIFCAIGLLSQRRFHAAAIAAAAAFLIHAPTTVPFWVVLIWISSREWKKTLPLWISLLLAVVVLIGSEKLEPVIREQQEFFTTLTVPQEAVQRMRAAYNWISLWWKGLLPQYLFLYALGLVALRRVGRDLPLELKGFAVILPALGMISMPLSWVLLEQLKWALVPQLQPMRVLLFVTAFAVILGAFAALKAKSLWEAGAWFLLVFFIPMRVELFDPLTWRVALTAIGLAAFAAVATQLPRPALFLAGVLSFIIIPGVGHISNYPNLHTPEIADLSRWARENTPTSAMFLFPDAERKVYPGIFRAEAWRAIYVDWKSGGQVNYLKDFAGEWRTRWELIHRAGYQVDSFAQYRTLGVDYIVLQHAHALPGVPVVYRNGSYAVYRTSE
jgi:hypothetical protein